MSRINTYIISGVFAPKSAIKVSDKQNLIAFEFMVRVEISEGMSSTEIYDALKDPVIKMLREQNPNYQIGLQDVMFNAYFWIDSFDKVDEVELEQDLETPAEKITT